MAAGFPGTCLRHGSIAQVCGPHGHPNVILTGWRSGFKSGSMAQVSELRATTPRVVPAAGCRMPTRPSLSRLCAVAPTGQASIDSPLSRLRRKKSRRKLQKVDTPFRFFLVFIGVTYTVLVVVLPFINVFFEAFRHGVGPFIRVLHQPEFLHAAKMTALVSLFTVPMNTVFGVLAAIMLSRYRNFPGRTFYISTLDIPFSISPVMTGLLFVLLYGRTGLFAPLLKKYGFNVIFALPGMVLGTTFVTIPFVVKTLLPTMEEWENQQEEASLSLGATEWKTFWKVTLPNIKWALLFGVLLLNTRAMGEFGAMSILSGNIIGQTQTLTLFVESSYREYNTDAAFAAAAILSFLSIFFLLAKKWLQRKAEEQRELNKA